MARGAQAVLVALKAAGRRARRAVAGPFAGLFEPRPDPLALSDRMLRDIGLERRAGPEAGLDRTRFVWRA